MQYNATTHSVSILPLDLADLKTVKSFAQQTLDNLKKDKLDILFLNAGMNKAAKGPGVYGSPWCEAYVVNHLCKLNAIGISARINSGRSTDCLHTTAQHYLTHLLREKLLASHSRVIVVSSGLIRAVKEDSISISIPTFPPHLRFHANEKPQNHSQAI